ncbi:MAG: hypothetical protein EOP76_16590 [Variovorax sp.]|nr:MAG: hypothetical protein EOP76_16590 [Variovorax sp.]
MRERHRHIDVCTTMPTLSMRLNVICIPDVQWNFDFFTALLVPEPMLKAMEIPRAARGRAVD